MNAKLSLPSRLSTYALLTGIGLLLGAPFVFMLSISLASDATTAKLAFSFIPREFELNNFVRVFTDDIGVGRFFWNSVVLVTLAVTAQVFSSALVAYGFARLRAPGRNFLFVLLLSTLMIPSEVTLIPQFVIFRNLGWFNTMLPLIVPNFFGGAYNIFLMRQFITRIPVDLDEAATLEGLGYFGIFRHIMLPLMKPVLVAVAVFSFAWNWGWFMGPLIYINDMDKMPLALGVQILSATKNAAQTPAWNLVMVASLMLTAPMILVYALGQRYIYEVNVSGGSAGLK